jgi:hypothetical protein
MAHFEVVGYKTCCRSRRMNRVEVLLCEICQFRC